MGADNNANIKRSKVNFLKIIKSKYIISKLFDSLSKKKILKIIQKNKEIQTKLEISLKDYITMSELNPIEIEIVPVANSKENFINLTYVNKDYVHIYFDDKKEEINECRLNEKDDIKKINIKIDHQIKEFHNLFDGCKAIKTINFIKFNRYTIEDMSYMFQWCTSLIEVNLSKFNTNNVSNMEGMFFFCNSLTKLDLSSLNTGNVTDMSKMFCGCSSLKTINLSKINTSNVTNMNRMFGECKSLKELNLSKFNTSNVTNMHEMFEGCTSLTKLNMSNFNTEKVTNMNSMFKD